MLAIFSLTFIATSKVDLLTLKRHCMLLLTNAILNNIEYVYSVMNKLHQATKWQ